MPLSWRLYLGLGLVVLATVGLAWLTTGRGVLGPLNDRVFDAFVDQAVYVAEQVEQGVPPEVAGQRMGLEVHVRHRPHDGEHRRRGSWRGHDVEILERDGREVRFRGGPRNRVAVETSAGWVAVRRDLDLERPRQRLVWLLVGCAILVGLAGTWVVRASLRPVHTAIQAMRQVADGDLAHRIPEDGPRELREVARAFHRMTERLDALTRADRQLVAGVSHEIRTPLSRMRLRLELLADEIGDHRRIDDIATDLKEIDRLVGELVTLSRLQLGGFRIDRNPAVLGELVTEALAATDLDGGRVLRSGDDDAEVEVDRELAVRAIANVLQNAHRHAPEGSVRVTFDGATVRVEDEGPGIDEAKLATIFDPFVQGRQSASGLGLGLMIVEQVMDLHGGEVSVANRPEGGLAVTLSWSTAPSRASPG